MPDLSLSTDPPDSADPQAQESRDESTEAFDLDALSAASDRYALTPGLRIRHPRPNVIIPLLGSLMVGVALTLAGRFDFLCVATLEIDPDVSAEQRTQYRMELLAYAWERQSTEGSGNSALDRWAVEEVDGNVLRLSVLSGSRSVAAKRAAQVAEGFCLEKRTEAQNARETPGQSETVFAEYVAELTEKIDAAQHDLDAFVDLPGEDPFQEHKTLRVQWDRMRNEFNDVRERLAIASREEEGLRTAPMPTVGLVRDADRTRMIEADSGLQQDLRELVVNLTESKQFAKEVWRRSVAPLDQLRVAAESLVDVAAPSVKRAASPATEKQAEALVTASEAYLEEIKSFTDRWHQQFAALESLDLDPLSDAILTELDRTRNLVNTFLFDAGEQLASLRGRVRSIGEDPREDARHHVFLADLTRAFQTVPSVHHRFEFVVRRLEGANNFRLDAAEKAARGLRHRSKDRVDAIEEHLRAKATQREKKLRIERVNAAEQLVRELRTETDRVVNMMLAIQKELNLTADKGETFSRALMKMEVTAGRLKLFQADMQRNQRRIRSLAADRVAAAESIGVRFVGTGPVGGPENLRERLGFGGLAAALTFATAVIGQWWIIRRAAAGLPPWRASAGQRSLPSARQPSPRKNPAAATSRNPIRMD